MSITIKKLLLVFLWIYCFAAIDNSIGSEKKNRDLIRQKFREKAKKVALVTATFTSSKDSKPQKMIFYVPPESKTDLINKKFPLLVMLHTWSGNYKQGMKVLPAVKQRKWVLVAPDFRGKNNNPMACASAFAIQDILDAIEYAKKNANIDESKIYLLGSSGGGHMALMMAAKAPNLWAAVSAWVPISNLSAWHSENLLRRGKYSKLLEKVCGGPPGSLNTDKNYRARSPLFILEKAKGLPVDINVGINDGHHGPVPISHSLNAFNVLVKTNGFKDKLISEDNITFMTTKRKIPQSLVHEKDHDPERGRAVLFRRIAGPTRITVFKGGHEGDNVAALKWLARQKKGKLANWRLGNDEKISPSSDIDNTVKVAP